MKPILLLLLSAIIFTAAARADEQLISTFSWKELADSGKLTAHRRMRLKSIIAVRAQ